MAGEKETGEDKNRRKIKIRFRFKTRVQSSFRYIVCLVSSPSILFRRVFNVVRARIRTLEAGVRTLKPVFKAVVDKWARPGVTPGSWCPDNPRSTAASTPNQF